MGSGHSHGRSKTGQKSGSMVRPSTNGWGKDAGHEVEASLMATISRTRTNEHVCAMPRAHQPAVTDAQLLDDFIDEQDETAFAELVRRHGPMVLGVCRRVLHNAHDAEDC